MGILKRRKNKKFDYTPRYYNSDVEGSPYQMRHKFDAYRSTVGENLSLKDKVKHAWGELRGARESKPNRTIWLIVAVLILLFLIIIDFDLSIFYSS